MEKFKIQIREDLKIENLFNLGELANLPPESGDSYPNIRKYVNLF